MARKQINHKRLVRPLLYTPLFIAAALGLYSTNCLSTNVVFDLGGVLFDINYGLMYRHICKQAGFTFLYYLLTKRENPRDLLFQVLNDINLPDIEQKGACDEVGNPLPKALVHWLQGTASNQEIRDTVESVLEEDFSCYEAVEKRVIKTIVNGIFDSKYTTSMLSLNKDGAELVQKCIKYGHKVFILSNMDAESFDVLCRQYPDFFDLFDGVVVSAKVHLIKPDPAIFRYLLDTYQLDPQETVFIDDQEENVKAAETVGIHAIQCPKIGWFARQDFESVNNTFIVWQTEHELIARQDKWQISLTKSNV
ncbi:HAD family phosphatase [Candidatus Dependentiae bacterium]|nr:MAG: HAD family phosphatase [Candidatus Dependentiae bacterium]